MPPSLHSYTVYISPSNPKRTPSPKIANKSIHRKIIGQASPASMQIHSHPSPQPGQVVLTMQQQLRHPIGSEPVKPRPTQTANLPVSRPKSRFVELNDSNPKPEPEPDSDTESEPETLDCPTHVADKLKPKTGWPIGPRAITESMTLIVLVILLTVSLTVPSLKGTYVWALKLWEWAVMLLVILCGRLIANWLVWTFVFLLEKNFPLKERVLYFVYGLRRSVRSCAWLALILLAWFLLFQRHRSRHSKAIHRISRALIAFQIATTIWLVKIILVKLLASSFHVNTFFDRMKESVFHHRVLDALSRDPVAEEKGEANDRHVAASRLKRLSRATRTAFDVGRLVRHVMRTGLTTVSRTMDRVGEQFGEAEAEITSEWEARHAAERVFRNVARPGNKYIEEEDLRRFLTEDEVRTILPMIVDGAVETGKIKKSAFRNWVVRAYRERKSLAHALNDTKTAVHQLHRLASGVVSVIIAIITLLVIGVATTKVLVTITSQLLLLGFMFQSTAKTIFESIVFVFVVHPFDSGDRCVIDGVQMIVEEMNILTTVFLRYDNEKIYYPNSVLLSKPISNFYRSPDMGDSIEFAIDFSTSEKTIELMKKAIQTYIESKPKYWHPKHSVVLKEIEDVNKIKMALFVLHTMNHQNFGERNSRRSELAFELKRIFEGLGIKYHLLPQEVQLTQQVMAEGRIPAPRSNTF